MTKRSCDAVGTKTEPKLYSEICADGLRKGKWTDEEETYATTIISHFENNLLPLSEHGVGGMSTLRLYLGKTLHCDPMRISKKFAGNNSVGKHFFCKKHDNGQNHTAEDLERAEKEREDMRRVFVVSVETEFEAASKRPKRIRIRNRKKKPKSEDDGLPIFQWGDEVLSDDDIGDLQSILVSDKDCVDKGDCMVQDSFVTTPRGSPVDSFVMTPPCSPVTKPCGPMSLSFEPDNFTLDSRSMFTGAYMEPTPALNLSAPPLFGVVHPPMMGTTYGYMVVPCNPSPYQVWVCSPPVAQQQLFIGVPAAPLYMDLPAAPLSKQEELDAGLEDILNSI